jgi:hypothetical protein
MTNAFTVSDILARGVIIEWHEGVALAREVAQHLAGDSEALPSLPDLNQIAVSPAGALRVLGGTAVDDPVRRFGQILQAMLAQSDPPVQLRLLISQATAPEPAFSSIREYDRALEFFDRPNRAAALQGLFARAEAAPAPAKTEAPARAEAIAPLPVARTPAASRGKTNPQRRTLRLAAAAALVGLTCVAGVLYARSAGVVPESGIVSNAAVEVSDTLGTAITTGLSAVSERVGLGRLVFGEETTPPPPAVTAAANAKGAAVRPRTSMLPGSAAVTLLAIDPVPLVDAAPMVAALARLAEGVNEENLAAEEDPATYSPGSEGVSPPVGVGPQLPREVPAGSNQSALGQIELVILPDGTVESAKLVGTPRHVVDSMLLSALKTWEFLPAMKDGRPVRYRKTVWLASQ